MSPGPILPGSTIGFLGGGQLARMSALAARSMGYGVAVLDPDPRCAAAPVADLVLAAPFDCEASAERLGAASDVVTIDIERIAPAAARAARRHAPVHPSPELLEAVQDRERQKRWLASRGHPVGAWLPVTDAASAAAAVAALGPCRLKRRRDGYDGRGQVRIRDAASAAEGFARLGSAPCVAERELSLELELSVLVARSSNGQVAVHPVARNWHEEGILVRSVLPGPVPARMARRAREIAADLAAGLDLVGLLAVEFFVDERGDLLVNELSPRPHNTFHAAGVACATGQFEQLIRAVCGLPLGETALHGAAALRNLLGDEALRAPSALFVPGVTLHLYGKPPRPRRKVGHLCAAAANPDEALARLGEAERTIGLASAMRADASRPREADAFAARAR